MKRKIAIVVIIIILILTGIFILWKARQNQFLHPKEEKNQNAIIDNKFINRLLGYEITVKNPWRLAAELSYSYALQKRSMVFANQNDCKIMDFEDIPSNTQTKSAFQECIKEHPQIKKDIEDFHNNWKIENSEYVALTDLSQKQETDFINSTRGTDKTILDFPAKNAIQIYPDSSNGKSFLSCEIASSKIMREYINLPDGTKACKIDTRNASFTKTNTIIDRFIMVIVPHKISYEINKFPVFTDGLIFTVGADHGSELEKTFFDVVNSLNFINK
jgi:hypothetical protein